MRKDSFKNILHQSFELPKSKPSRAESKRLDDILNKTYDNIGQQI